VKKKRLILPILCFLFLLSGCYKPGPGAKTWQVSGVDGGSGGGSDTVLGTPTSTTLNSQGDQDIFISPTFDPSISTPTPNPPIAIPTPRQETIEYTVQAGDRLGAIARTFQVTVNQIIILSILRR